MTVTVTTSGSATERQIAFIEDLLKKREGFSEGFELRVRSGIKSGALDKHKASEVIDWLLKKPKRSVAKETSAIIAAPAASASATAEHIVAGEVPPGHYAIESITGNNDLDFFRVDVPETGKYAGRVFVKRIVGGHPEFNVKRGEVQDVLNRIVAAGVDDSAKLYGTEIGRCYVCNRTLTDDLSRSLGIGPHCRS